MPKEMQQGLMHYEENTLDFVKCLSQEFCLPSDMHVGNLLLFKTSPNPLRNSCPLTLTNSFIS